MLHDSIAPRLRCSKCGGKKVGVTLSPGGNARMVPGPNIYQNAKGR